VLNLAQKRATHTTSITILPQAKDQPKIIEDNNLKHKLNQEALLQQIA